MAIWLSLLAAVLLGTGFVLQQRAASRQSAADLLRPRLLLHLVRSPQWLCGIGSMVSGQILSAIALGMASITLVEPLLAANLAVALALGAGVSRQWLRRTDWLGAAALIGGLAVFVVAGQPQLANGAVSLARRWAVMGVIAGTAAILVSLARSRPLPDQAVLLAGAAGCLAGLQDGFTRSAVVAISAGFGGLLRTWQAYAVICVAVVVILLQQSAFKAGPLRRSLPPLTAGEPLAGIGFGIGVFGDRLSTSPVSLTFELLGLAAMVTGIVLLATSPVLARAVGQHHHHQDR